MEDGFDLELCIVLSEKVVNEVEADTTAPFAFGSEGCGDCSAVQDFVDLFGGEAVSAIGDGDL